MVFSQQFKSRHSECDPELRVTPPAMLDYFQEVGGRHCIPYGMAVPEIIEEHGLSWVLSGLAVRFEAYPRWPEELTVETWARSLKGFKALRDFQAKESTGHICTRACSSWALIDVKSRRPVRMDAYGDRLPQSPDLSALPDARPGKVMLPDSFDGKEELITVSPADLDYNHHVNNIRYLVWLMMYQDEDFLKQRELAELNIAFLGETVSGDRLILRGSSVGDNDRVYIFQREADGKEVCRMFTSWRKREG